MECTISCCPRRVPPRAADQTSTPLFYRHRILVDLREPAVGLEPIRFALVEPAFYLVDVNPGIQIVEKVRVALADANTTVIDVEVSVPQPNAIAREEAT